MALLFGIEDFFAPFMAASALRMDTRAPRVPQAPSLYLETADFGSDPGKLRMLSFVPDDLPAGAPLVVVLHGCGQTAAEYDRGTGWSTLADRFGFALLLPEQRRANNGNGCFDWFQTEDVTRGNGEVASIAAMIATMAARYGVDRRRIYVTGLSAGGAMTAALLATYPELFAGGAIIAGLPFGSASTVSEAFGTMMQGRVRGGEELGGRVRAASEHDGAWPAVSIWQGTADNTVNPMNAEELRKQWGDVHDLPATPTVSDVVDGAAHRAWRGADGRMVLETYMIAGLGHATPIDPDAMLPDARCGEAGGHIVAAGISSTYRIAESWGLTGERRANSRPAPDQRAGSSRPAWVDYLPLSTESVQDMAARLADTKSIIAKALRSAGLVDKSKHPR
jgi:poly(hydroxyalkanoate) depolymerase family esterase